MYSISQTALEQVLSDIRTGNTEYVQDFFDARPEWLNEDEDETEEEKEVKA